MRREDLEMFHYITPIANVPKILDYGIFAHLWVQNLRHESVALPQVQDRRSRVTVPDGRPHGRPLHDYANLYFCARNPMLYYLKDHHAKLCVLHVSVDVLDLPGVVVTDRNAARRDARFSPASSGLDHIDWRRVFANDWQHPGDSQAQDDHKGIKCAEVLVPYRVPPKYILGAYVPCRETRATLRNLVPSLVVAVNPHLFFRA